MPPRSSGLFGSIAYGMSEVGKMKVRYTGPLHACKEQSELGVYEIVPTIFCSFVILRSFEILSWGQLFWSPLAET
ncbi:uncharacterized protein LOC114315288 isoform X2 [Camellia sinensis]|uniref:uncharacterized protein LOC114315288 isoform X2 n=1 Tax=Camellia sinensis TaxID=4442 RepID=UPI0010357E1F|nr:uncharacterized protein LOC114315288 isoform X2 [Camellia sinensis]XP_028117704.1 uncharacterized protein LOC114315288 isoform X2 [Camellia sinensis]